MVHWVNTVPWPISVVRCLHTDHRRSLQRVGCPLPTIETITTTHSLDKDWYKILADSSHPANAIFESAFREALLTDYKCLCIILLCALTIKYPCIAELCSSVHSLMPVEDYRQYVCVVDFRLDVKWYVFWVEELFILTEGSPSKCYSVFYSSGSIICNW